MPKRTQTRKPRNLNQAESFFWHHAGWSYKPGAETPSAGRARCARSLALAEDQGREAGLSFTWAHDDQTDESFRETENPYPLWVCQCWKDSDCTDFGASCGGIDLGADGSPYRYSVGGMGEPTYKRGGRDPYCRVMEAELAAETLASVEA